MKVVSKNGKTYNYKRGFLVVDDQNGILSDFKNFCKSKGVLMYYSAALALKKYMEENK